MVAAVFVATLAGLWTSTAPAASVSYAEHQVPQKRPGVFMEALTDESPAPRVVVTPATVPPKPESAESADVAAATIGDGALANDPFAATASPTSVWLGPDSQTPTPDEDLSTGPVDATVTGVAIPIPPGVWTGLSGLGGLAVVLGWQKLRRRRRRPSCPA